MSKIKNIPYSKEQFQQLQDGARSLVRDFIYDDSIQEKLDYREMMYQQYDRIRNEGRTVDTIGADYFLLKEFITNEMYWDFDVILEDFLKHCLPRLREFDEAAWYHNDELYQTTPERFLMTKVMNLIYNGAKLGDEYCVALMKQLYMTYHKKEYKILKRFRKITPGEILSFADNRYEEFAQQALYGRILGMCRLFGIELDEQCTIMYMLLMQDYQEDMAIFEEESEWEIPNISDELWAECIDQIEAWMGKDLNFKKQVKVLKQFLTVKQFAAACMHFHRYPDYYVEDCLENNMGVRMQMARTLAMLRLTYPEREWQWEEVQTYCVIYTLCAALAGVSDKLKEDIGMLIGEEDPYRRGPDEPPLFNPGKIQLPVSSDKCPAAPKAPISPVKTAKLSEDDYLKEIEELRQKLNAKERALNNLKDMYHTEKQNSSQYHALLAKYEAEHEELISLRDFAYHSTEIQEEIATEALDDMKAVVAQKKIMLVGGHTNWLNKLKKEFPDWIYIPAEISTVCDGKMLENLDKLYFFTDHLSHGTYGKYVAMAREKKIPFGYVKNINLEMIIRQVYEDLG